MYKIDKLKNGLTLITVDIPRLNSVTTMVAVGAGSRYEIPRINGLSHFLEHMFFKGSIKYPSAEQIATLVDSIGAVNNAATSKEYTYYWMKSAAKHLELSSDIIASMLKEPLFSEEEIEREKGVIIEEMRMRNDNPMITTYELFEQLILGEDQPLGFNPIGKSETINALNRKDFIKYVDSLYAPENMVLVYAGKLPSNIKEIAEKYFSDLPKRTMQKPKVYKTVKQIKPKVRVNYKKSDQAHIMFGVLGYDRHDPKKYAAGVLGTILGSGMSSRLFIQVRERRGLAYHVAGDHDSYIDTGIFSVYAGLKVEKVYEGIEVIKAELERTAVENVTDDELKKAKEMIRGHLALRSESTNFLAEYFGLDYVLDRELESFEDYLKKIDAVTVEDVREVAKELFKKERYNLQVVGPFKSSKEFEKILNQ